MTGWTLKQVVDKTGAHYVHFKNYFIRALIIEIMLHYLIKTSQINTLNPVESDYMREWTLKQVLTVYM